MADDAAANNNDPDNVKLQHEGWSDIREKPRGCTDILLLLLLLSTWVAVSIIGLIVTGAIPSTTLSMGNPYRLVGVIDYSNHVCGFGPGVEKLPYGFYLPDKTAVCVSSCPSVTDYTRYICTYDVQAFVDSDPYGVVGLYYMTQYKCFYKIKTNAVLKRCVPAVDPNKVASAFATQKNATTLLSSTVYPTPSTAESYVSMFWADVINLLPIIAPLGLGLSAVVSFLYLYFLRIPGLLMVTIWSVLLAVQGLLVVLSILLFTLSNTWSTDGTHSTGEVVAMKVFAIAGFAVSFLYFCFLVVMRKRVQLAIHVIQEAAKALAAMPFLIVMPILQVVGMVMFLVPWFIYVVYLASSGDMVTMTGKNALGVTYSYRQYVFTPNTQYTFIFMLFAWFWTAEFIVAMGQISIALAVVAWYFNRDKSTVGNTTVFWAIRTAFRYHTGTAAFGSMLIAIVQTARAVIAYMQRHAKATKNKVMEYLLCVLQCCMWCLEKCMKFVNKNAYIQTAIFGYSFCKAMRCAFFLILRNILRVAAVSMVADVVLSLGKMLVPLLTTFVAYLIIAYGVSSASINSIIAPLVLVWLLAYFVSSMFTEIFSMSIETILCCFVADEEMFPAGQRFAEGSLAESVAAGATAKPLNARAVAVSASDDAAK
jgi:choline transporter-like protein 2/4/5